MRFDHYQVLQDAAGNPALLGRGGMGETYRAQDTILGREVALKVVHAHLLADPAVRSRFLREARATAGLHHRNIATVHHQGQTGDTCYYVMEFIRGVTLQDVLQTRGPLDVRRALGITRQVVQALAEAETQGLVHRDIKPANIMLVTEADGHELVKLIDFGLAKFAQAPGEAEVTRQGSFLGTASTSSPEQCRGEELDSRSDFYSLGVTLWQMLDGRPPFDDPLPMKVLMAHLQETPPFKRLDRQPKPVVRLLRRLLEKDRDRRPANTADLMRLLDECASAAGVGADPVTLASAPTRRAPVPQGPDDLTRMTMEVPLPVRKRSPVVPVLAVLALVAGGAFVAWRWLIPVPTPVPVTQPVVTNGGTTGSAAVPVAPPSPPNPDALRAEALAAAAVPDPVRLVQALDAWQRSGPEGEAADPAAFRDAFARAYPPHAPAWHEALAGDAAAVRLATGLASNALPALWIPLGEVALAAGDRDRALAGFAAAAERAAELTPELGATAALARLDLARGKPDAAGARDGWAAALGRLQATGPVPLRDWLAAGALPRLESVADAHAPTLAFLAGGPDGVPDERARHWRRELVQRAERARDWPAATEAALSLWKDRTATAEGEWALGRLNHWLGQWMLSGPPAGWPPDGRLDPRIDALADAGIPAAMEWAGKRRLTASPDQARAWFERAAQAGSATAAAQMGLMLLEGAGGPADPALAGEWLRQARDRGGEAGMILLADALLAGRLTEAAPGEAVAALRMAAERGNGRAMDRLGDCYRRGNGVDADPAQALAWFEDAIDAGHWNSLGNMGVMRMLGEGGPADKPLAVSLFQQGADKGDAWCMFLLGQSYWAGEGVPASRDQAVQWLRKAASAGRPEAAAFLRDQGL